MSALRAILELTTIAGACGTVELNFLRWVVAEGTPVATLADIFTQQRHREPKRTGLPFIAEALQTIWRGEKKLPASVQKQLGEPEVLIIALLAAAEGGSMVRSLERLYIMVFAGNLHVGDDEYGDLYSVEAFVAMLAQKLTHAQAVPDKAAQPMALFEHAWHKGPVLDVRISPSFLQ